MKLGIMQPYFFPYIGYFQLINAVNQFIIYDDVNYIKQGWINRNRILIDGKPSYITLPLSEASSFKKIIEIKIKINPKKLLRTITQSYKKAPYFFNVFPLIEDILTFDEQNLAKFVSNSILKVSNYLDINTSFISSSEMQIGNELKGKDRVIFLCNLLNANYYYNTIGGIDLYSKEEFSTHGIKLSFIKTKEITYKQFDDTFVPNLSIIDVMMFNSKDEIKKMLNEYELI